MASAKFNYNKLAKDNADLIVENLALRVKNETLKAELELKNEQIKVLNGKLDEVDKTKNLSRLKAARVAQGITKKEDKPCQKSYEYWSYLCPKDPLEKEFYTGFGHKFCKQQAKNQTKCCERCDGVMEKGEEYSQCLYCSETFHPSCAFVTGKTCLSRGSVPETQKAPL